MIRLAKMNEIGKTQTVDDVFAGYNHNLRINDGEFYDTKNLTSDLYPILSPRAARGVYRNVVNANGIIAKEHLCYVDGNDFIITNDGGEDEVIHMGLDADTDKTLVSMGAYVIILPDAKYINTADTSDYGKIDEVAKNYITRQQTQTQTCTFQPCRYSGDRYEPFSITYTQSETPTGNIQNGAYWLDTSSKPNTLKQYSEATAQWVTVLTTYVMISGLLEHSLGSEDGVKITIEIDGNHYHYHHGDVGIRNRYLDEIRGFYTLVDSGTDYVVITGLIDAKVEIDNRVTIERKMPKMDFIIESQNRLWGCRYGTDNYGQTVNQIYASKLGDFKNWTCFGVKSTDSYYVDIGTDGPWTGAVTYLGYPTFFKENHIHKVFGNYPANYQVQETSCRGVQVGSERSLAMVNEVLFYKSPNGICAFSGSLPTDISYQFGNVRYSDAVASAFGNKYYVSMKDEKGEHNLFVYDTLRQMWLKEDNTQVTQFCEHNGELFYIDASGSKIMTINGTGTPTEDKVSWMAESGVIGMNAANKKYIARMFVKMALDIGTSVRFYVQYDSTGQWQPVCHMMSSSLRTFNVPIKPKRCDHFRIRIVGDGGAKIYSITKELEIGGDMR